MSSIRISNLQPAGSEFFNDRESFLNELTDDEMMLVEGGKKSSLFKGIKIKIVIRTNAQTLITINTNTINANTIGAANSIVV